MAIASTDIFDVFIAGGGPAGLAAGIAAAQRGLRAAVADPARPPVEKACGEGIMPAGVGSLNELGVDWNGLGAAALEGIRFVDAAGEVSARFAQGAGVGMKRSILHRMLTARAESVGVRLAWGTRVEAVRQGEAVAGGRTICSRYVVCADGQNSSLRPMVGLDAGKVYRRRYGFRNHYAVQPWSRYVEVHWADCGQLYVTPVGAEDVCIAFLTSDPRLRLEEALAWFPEVRERLAGEKPSAAPMGGVTVTRKLEAVTSGCVALLGDASGGADAITGDGLSLAFQQATALADAMASGDLSAYQRMHEEIGTVPRNMGELMLVMHDYPWVRPRMFRGFARSPRMFEMLLAMHTRAISPRQLGMQLFGSPAGMRDCLSFGWSALRA